ncbi:hypothetical protein THOG05_10239 [Vibrio rotiferianus]|nr:hypothetical protein THOG05_10239 [Vibrio rotiferianus]CAH1552651.1 hypothetical protein THOE12_130031 [Vibrio rotiferianus]CAH1568537.1 hypothetical protein THOG10_190031 [Vibrio rotiferianus]CAH1570618.1 hypothetical protein THOB06_190031 [Vibrio rotiferianus]
MFSLLVLDYHTVRILDDLKLPWQIEIMYDVVVARRKKQPRNNHHEKNLGVVAY